MASSPCTIEKVEPQRLTAEQIAQLDRIFFEGSGRRFASDEDRTIFRERWLGRYLQGGSDVVLVAQDGSATILGYLVGATEDPARQHRFADITYFRSDFRDLCCSYPAHLHINLAPAFRNRGLGARLINAFAAHARAFGATGMHVVTGSQARNVSFYTRCGFAPLGTAAWNSGEIVFLGRRLTHSP